MHKKTIIVLLFVTLASHREGAVPVYALANSSSPQIVTSEFNVFTDFTDEKALEFASELLKLHAFYNETLQFDSNEREQERMNVRYFATKPTFDFYLQGVLGRTYPNFVFLDYDDPAKNELVIYQKSVKFEQDLIYFSFLQFIESFVPVAPAWIKEGYALYFANSTFDENRASVIFRENTEWLAALKEIIIADRLIELDRFFGMDATEAQAERQVFYPQAWGMVSFFLSYKKTQLEQIAQNIHRALGSSASYQENVTKTTRAIQGRFDFAVLESEFREFILAKDSADDALAAAIEQYTNGQFREAERMFYDIIDADENNPTPYYYVGIIHYDRKDYESAERYYMQALMLGGDAGTIYYALGVNAFAAQEREKAMEYFDQALAADSTLFDKVAEILEEEAEEATPARSPQP